MDGIFELEGVLTENDCDRIIEIYNRNLIHASAGQIGSGQNSRVEKIIKNTMDIYLPIKGDLSTNAVMRIIHHACKKTYNKYVEHFQELGIDRGNHDEPSHIQMYGEVGELSNPQIQKVSPGGRFNWHSDCGLGNIIQYIFYLNDDYDGGRTEFSNGRVIEPKKGKVAIIPCTIQALHRGNVVTRGIKYISAVYLQHKDTP